MSFLDNWEESISRKTARHVAPLDQETWEMFLRMSQAYQDNGIDGFAERKSLAADFAEKAPEVYARLSSALMDGAHIGFIEAHARLFRRSSSCNTTTNPVVTELVM